MFFSAVPNFDVRRTEICVHTRTGQNLPFLFLEGTQKALLLQWRPPLRLMFAPNNK